LYSDLLQKLRRKRLDLPQYSWMQPFDYDSDYFTSQPDQGATLPYKRKGKGRCYFHAINCW